MNVNGLDEIDERIIAMLKDNARISLSDMGKVIGITRVSVKNRIAALEKQGIIRGYHAEVDSSMLPEGIRFFLDIETMPEAFVSVLGKLSSEREIWKIYGTTGESRLHAEGFAPSVSQMNYLAGRLQRTQKGILRMSLQVALTIYKDVNGGVDYERLQNQEHEHLEGEGQP